MATHYLTPYADFFHDKKQFFLNDNPFPEQDITLGEYKLGKPIEDSHNFRTSHPLAQKILRLYKEKPLPPSEIIFEYSNHPTTISVLENLIGKSGYILLNMLTLEALEIDDYLVCSGITENGDELNDDECFRLLSVAGRVNRENLILDKNVRNKLSEIYQNKKELIFRKLNEKNGNIFDEEMDKLDKWADDKKISLRVVLKEIEEETKELKKKIKNSSNLPEKIKNQKRKQVLDKKYDDSWRDYEVAQKEIENSKYLLIDKIEKKMNQKVIEESLFKIKWVVI